MRLIFLIATFVLLLPNLGQATFSLSLNWNHHYPNPNTASKLINVLDGAIWNPRTSHLILMGHQDPKYSVHAIPYQQFFKTILKNSNPAVTLLWQENSKNQIIQWMDQLESPSVMQDLSLELFRLFNKEEKIAPDRFWLAEKLGISEIDLKNNPNRLTVLKEIYSQLGKEKSVFLIEDLFRIKASHYLPASISEMVHVLEIGGYDRWIKKMNQEMKKKGKISSKTYHKVFKKFFVVLEKSFDFPRKSLLKTYKRSFKNFNSPEKAFNVAFEKFFKDWPKNLAKDLHKILNQYDEIQVPPEVLAKILKIEPRMKSVYVGVQKNDPLADLLFRADYLTKHLAHQPRLVASIAGYQTEFSYDQHQLPRMNGSTGSRDEQIHRRMWLFPDYTRLAPGNMLFSVVIQETKMAFHEERLLEKNQSKDLKDGYSQLLTSLYDPLSQQFPVLHQMREASKLAALARWYQELPQAHVPKPKKEVFYPGSNDIKGALYFSFSPKIQDGTSRLRMVAEGGALLSLPSKEFFHSSLGGKFSFTKNLDSHHPNFLKEDLENLARDLLAVKKIKGKPLPLYSTNIQKSNLSRDGQKGKSF